MVYLKTKRYGKKVIMNKGKYGYKMKCLQCNYEWWPKLKSPYKCPRCSSLI